MADHRPQYEDADVDSDGVILHGIITRHLHIAAECPADQLAALYDRWNKQDEDHPLHSLAICRVLEILEPILEMLDTVPVPPTMTPAAAPVLALQHWSQDR